MQSQLGLPVGKKRLRRKLTMHEQQAYEGAKSFYYCFVPVSMTGMLISHLYILEEYFKKMQTSPQINLSKGDLLLSIAITVLSFAFYYLAVKVYIKCNQIDTTPIFQQTDLKQELVIVGQNLQGQNSLLGLSKPLKFVCKVCNITCDYRTKHCRKCQVCIQRYDHHCFWIGNCVGRHNHKPFYLFLFYQTVNNILNFSALYRISSSLSILEIKMHPLIYWIYVIVMLLAVGFIAFTGYLFIYHTMLVLNGITTWEHMRRSRIQYLKHLPAGYNPYSIGIIENIKQFMVQPTRFNGCQTTKKYDQQIPTFEESQKLKPVFNLIDNEYYSCC